MLSYEMPSVFASSATGRTPERCDRCEARLTETSGYVIVKVLERWANTLRQPVTRLEVAACDGCFSGTTLRVSPQTLARVSQLIDRRIEEKMFRSDYRDENRDVLMHFAEGGDGPSDPTGGLDRDLHECRLCGQDADRVPQTFDSERYIYCGQFRGDRLVVPRKSRLSFGLPMAVCGCCEAAAKDKLSSLQLERLASLYSEFSGADGGFGPVLPLFAENLLGQRQSLTTVVETPATF